MKYVIEAMLIILFVVVPLLAYGLSDIALWLTVGKSEYALTICYPLYCLLLLLVLNMWVKRHNQR
jgi:hypothetical protein